MSTGDAFERDDDDGEVTGQIRIAAEEGKRLSDRVRIEKKKISRKLEALRRKLSSQYSSTNRRLPSR